MSLFNMSKGKIYEIKETKSALKGVTKQYTIDGQGDVDPSTFLKKSNSKLLICCHNNARQRLV